MTTTRSGVRKTGNLYATFNPNTDREVIATKAPYCTHIYNRNAYTKLIQKTNNLNQLITISCCLVQITGLTSIALLSHRTEGGRNLWWRRKNGLVHVAVEYILCVRVCGAPCFLCKSLCVWLRLYSPYPVRTRQSPPLSPCFPLLAVTGPSCSPQGWCL